MCGSNQRSQVDPINLVCVDAVLRYEKEEEVAYEEEEEEEGYEEEEEEEEEEYVEEEELSVRRIVTFAGKFFVE